MPAGTMRIEYLSYSSVTAANSAANSYQNRAKAYTAINFGIAETYEHGVYYDCEDHARQDVIANRKLCEKKQQAFTQFEKALKGLYARSAEVDREVARVFGYNKWEQLWESIINDRIYKPIFKAICDRFDAPIDSVITYYFEGKFTIYDAGVTILKSARAVTKWVYKKTIDIVFLPITVVTDFSDAYKNRYRKYKNGEISAFRMVIEWLIEGSVSSLLDIALEISSVDRSYARWAIDTSFKKLSGQGIAENIGDFPVTVLEGIGMLLGEASIQVSNAVDNAINATADWFHGGFIKKAENAFASWLSL